MLSSQEIFPAMFSNETIVLSCSIFVLKSILCKTLTVQAVPYLVDSYFYVELNRKIFSRFNRGMLTEFVFSSYYFFAQRMSVWYIVLLAACVSSSDSKIKGGTSGELYLHFYFR